MHKTLLIISLLLLVSFTLEAQSNESIYLKALSRADSINQVEEKERQLKIAKLKAIHQAFIKNRDKEIASENKIIQQKQDSVLQARSIQRDLEYKTLQFKRSEAARKRDSTSKANYAKAKIESDRIREQYKNQPNSIPTSNNKVASPYKARVYYFGPRGGCYYINPNGNKTYVQNKNLCK